MHSFKVIHHWNICCGLARLLQNNFYGKVNCLLFSTSATDCSRFKSKYRIVNKNVKNSNPGISHRLKIIENDTPNLDSAIINEEDIEELEGDFLNARQMQEYYVREAEKLRHRDELKMTERKHFKPPVQPNMLMWSEIEQIKLLHREDPVAWNIERLSESFPATPQIIKKILKSNYIPQSNDRVRKHDEVVASNWEAFDEGRLDISCPQLKEHLRKFTGRRLPFTSGEIETAVSLPKPKGSEFVGIIHSYKTTYSSEETTTCKEKENHASHSLMKNDNECDKFINKKKHFSSVYTNNQCDYTLDKLRDVVRKRQSSTDLRFLKEEDKIFLKGVSSESDTVAKKSHTIETTSINPFSFSSIGDENVVKDKEETQVSLSSTSCQDVKQLEHKSDDPSLFAPKIPKRIHIPKNKVKIGYLYKVDDCFYSHDGYFLYRVPGMADVKK